MRTVSMMWLLLCNLARNNCSISWAPLRGVIVSVIAAVIALAVDDRNKTNVCTNPRLLRLLLILPRVWMRKESAKVCRCQWVGSFQVASRGATLIPYSAILSWRILSFFSSTRSALHWMATKAPLKHFDCIATYRCRFLC